LETSLAERAPGAFTFKLKQAPELYPTGTPELDELLSGGIPRGQITEISGAATTGRTALALALLGKITRQGDVCAWVDAQDSLNPESAAAYGVQLERLLWVRAGNASTQSGAPDSRPVMTKGPRTSDSSHSTPERHLIGGHPRHEMRAMSGAVIDLFQPRCSEAQPHSRKVEQIPTDRMPPRRGETVLAARADLASKCLLPVEKVHATNKSQKAKRSPEKGCLEQALRATDLLLQAGGFGLVLLDMGDARPELVSRIALSWWYRFRLCAEQTQTTLILLTQAPCAKSCASLVLRCYRDDAISPWSFGSKKPLFTTFECKVAIERTRHEQERFNPRQKKPVSRTTTEWFAKAPWAR
jgi:recombination protein RecA